MAKNRSDAGPMTARRSARLYQLLLLLSKGPQTREFLLRKLRMLPRGFYRDLQTLRQLRVGFVLADHHYRLTERFETAIARLPFPDPLLNWHEALQLSRGRGPAPKKMKERIRQLTALH